LNELVRDATQVLAIDAADFELWEDGERVLGDPIRIAKDDGGRTLAKVATDAAMFAHSCGSTQPERLL
jgi:hypothetical protein